MFTTLVVNDVGTAYVGNSEGDVVDPFDGVSFFGGAKGACAGVNVGVIVDKDDSNDGMVIEN